MADYFTHFSCVLDVGTPDHAARALDLYPAFMKEAAREGTLAGGFQVSIHPDQGRTKLWMRDEVTGDPLQVIIFVQRCAEAVGLTVRVARFRSSAWCDLASRWTNADTHASAETNEEAVAVRARRRTRRGCCASPAGASLSRNGPAPHLLCP